MSFDPKADPLNQSTIGDQVREQMSKHTLWLNASNFEEMVEASYEGYRQQHQSIDAIIPQKWREEAEAANKAMWRMMCAAALAVVEWRMGGRVRP